MARAPLVTVNGAALSQELRLLIACGQPKHVDADVTGLVAALNEQNAWENFLELAQHHGMLPLVQRLLSRVEAVPTGVKERLSTYARQNALRNLGMAHELIRLVEALAAAGIVAVPYKGLTLACAAYGDLSLRSFQDLDILVTVDAFAEAVAVVQGAGYVLTETAEGKFHASFREPERGTLLELHYDVLRRTRFPTTFELEPLWDELESVELLGHALPSFQPEETLLLLCLHGAKHEWQGLLWLSDISAYLKTHPALNCQRLLGIAERAGLSRVVLLGLLLAHEVLDSDVSSSVLQAFDDADLRRAHDLVMSRFLGTPGLLEEGLLPYRLRYLLQPSLIGKLRTLGQMAAFFAQPNEQDRRAVPLPPALGAASYLVRPVRLARHALGQRFKNPS